MRNTALYILLILASATVGCGKSSVASNPSAEGPQASLDRSKYELSDEPSGAVGVIAAREQAQNDQELVVVGRVSDRIEGLAAFTLLDASMKLVGEGQVSGERELCKASCCNAERAGCTLLVKLVGEDGRPLPVDSQQLLGFNDSDTLVVKGRVVKDESENLFLVAQGVYVRK